MPTLFNSGKLQISVVVGRYLIALGGGDNVA